MLKFFSSVDPSAADGDDFFSLEADAEPSDPSKDPVLAETEAVVAILEAKGYVGKIETRGPNRTPYAALSNIGPAYRIFGHVHATELFLEEIDTQAEPEVQKAREDIKRRRREAEDNDEPYEPRWLAKDRWQNALLEEEIAQNEITDRLMAEHVDHQNDLRRLGDLLKTCGYPIGDCFIVRYDREVPPPKHGSDDLVVGTAYSSVSSYSGVTMTRKSAEALPPLSELPARDPEELSRRVIAAGVSYWPGMTSGEPRKMQFITPWCPVGGRVCVYGKESVGKTTWLVDELMAIACRREAVIVYFALDGGANIQTRIAAAFAKHDMEGAPPFFIVPRIDDLDLGRPGSGWKVLEREVETAVAACINLAPEAANLPTVIVVETLSTALNGADENGQGTAFFLSGAGAFVRAAEERRSFVFSHHPNAKGERPRGYGAIAGNCDLVLKAVARSNGVVTVAAEKFRDGKKGTLFSTFKVASTADGDTVTVAPVGKREEPTPPVEGLTETERKAWEALDRMDANADGLEETEFSEVLSGVIDEKGIKSDTLRQRRKRLRDSLITKGVVEVRDKRLYLRED